MINPAPFLDPRGQPRDGRMELIGGPRDGERWSMYTPAPRHEGGRYVYADQREWAFVWLPDVEPHGYCPECGGALYNEWLYCPACAAKRP